MTDSIIISICFLNYYFSYQNNLKQTVVLKTFVVSVRFCYRGLVMSWGRWNHSCNLASCPTPTCVCGKQKKKTTIKLRKTNQKIFDHTSSMSVRAAVKEKTKTFPYLHQVRPRLHGACPVVSALRDSQVRHQQVRGQVARGEGAIRSLKKRDTGHATGVSLSSTQR